MPLIPVVISKLTTSEVPANTASCQRLSLLANAACQLRNNINRSMLLYSSNGTMRKAVCCAKTQKQNETAGTFPARGNVPAVSFFLALACICYRLFLLFSRNPIFRFSGRPPVSVTGSFIRSF